LKDEIEKKIQLYKRIKKIPIKRTRIKTKIQNKFYFLLEGEIENNSQLSKTKKTKSKA
jgi:hypothetical protein